MKRIAYLLTSALVATPLTACLDDGGRADEDPSSTTAIAQALTTTEDGLKVAFDTFKGVFTGAGRDRRFRIGFGHHPGLSTEKLSVAGVAMRGSAVLDFDTRRVTADLVSVPANVSADLWFVKNISGTGKTVRPESGDQLLKVGTFTGTGAQRTLDVSVGSNINFDLDLIVVTRKGQSPTASRLLTGARTLFERRFFHERANDTKPYPVAGPVATDVETTDQLVGRGAQLFFNETFGGNGRTCGTCHRADNNLTIDPAFIARLPQSDPLFVAETNPTNLGALEKPALMRQFGLILENVDGFEDPTHKFVMRGVPHTLAMVVTQDILASNIFPLTTPDQALGWGGDGGPGRGGLSDFSFGAVFQHFTKTLQRRPGTDFRVPTQEEMDALEAFQLFTGRQKLTNVAQVQFREQRAQSGKNLFNSTTGQCFICHVDLNGLPNNLNFNTGVATLIPPSADRPDDDGFLSNRTFNVPPLLEAADTAPLFHNNTAATIEDAVAFYVSAAFQTSADGRFFPVALTAADQLSVAAFLRVVNAAENIRQVRKRVQFVRNNRTGGNSSLLDQAIADTRDALEVLSAKALNPAAQNILHDVELTLQTARANADNARPPFMDHALVVLDLAKADLLTADPTLEF